MPFGFQNEYEGGREEADLVCSDIIRPAVEITVREFQTRYGDRIEHELHIVRELENRAIGTNDTRQVQKTLYGGGPQVKCGF
jgi:hypothetical protein